MIDRVSMPRFIRLRRVSKDARGVSAMEFALIAPIMALFYAGSIELSTTLLADRKVAAAASTMGDLVARMTTADMSELDNVFDATALIMSPLPTGDLQLRISSIEPNASTPSTMEVRWSYANANWEKRADGEVITLPAGIMATNGSILMAEISYEHSPPFNRVFRTDPTLDDTFYMRPRGIDRLQCTDCPGD